MGEPALGRLDWLLVGAQGSVGVRPYAHACCRERANFEWALHPHEVVEFSFASFRKGIPAVLWLFVQMHPPRFMTLVNFRARTPPSVYVLKATALANQCVA